MERLSQPVLLSKEERAALDAAIIDLRQWSVAECKHPTLSGLGTSVAIHSRWFVLVFGALMVTLSQVFNPIH
jgi:hypothetical protein